jgi:site-specific DNA-methyltransferase (cytosine-N4-specific)
MYPDPFAGSNTTGYVAETLDRRWIAIEIKEEYLRDSQLRFEKSVSDQEPSGSTLPNSS